MTQTAPTLTDRLRHRLRRLALTLRLRASLRHLHGPRAFDLAPDDVVVVVVVKNGAYYLDAFFDHYRALGARHFVFVDNGSTDATLARIRAEPGTVIVQSTLTIHRFEVEFRRHAAQSFARNHWVLFADIDELFDFEGREVLGLSGLARYLRAQGYTALMAQMLDLFPKASIQSHAATPFARVIDAYRYYDLTALDRYDYDDYDAIAFSYFMRTNTVASDRLKFLFGGVRKKIFGEPCCLTKHPLVFVDHVTSPNPHPHTAAHVRVADFSAVLKHYKFTDDPFARDRQTLREGIIIHGADRQRLAVVRDRPDISFHSDDAREYTGIAQLYDDGFLVPSPVFSAFVAAQRRS